jgi:hypothetical protein
MTAKSCGRLSLLQPFQKEGGAHEKKSNVSDNGRYDVGISYVFGWLQRWQQQRRQQSGGYQRQRQLG